MTVQDNKPQYQVFPLNESHEIERLKIDVTDFDDLYLSITVFSEQRKIGETFPFAYQFADIDQGTSFTSNKPPTQSLKNDVTNGGFIEISASLILLLILLGRKIQYD